MKKESQNTFSIEDLGVTREQVSLSNGSKLVVFEKPGAPVYMRAALEIGSRYDPVDKEGCAHFLEHTVVAGTKSFPTKDKLAAYIEQYGGSIGGTTGREVFSINSSIGDPADFPKAVRVMHEMLLESRFDKRVIETERGSVLQELARKKASPESSVWEKYSELFFQGTPLERSTLGSEETIKGITKDDIIDYYKNGLVSSRMVLVVAGGIGLDKARDAAESKLLVPHSEDMITKSQLPELRDKVVAVEHFPSREIDTSKDPIQVVFGCRAPEMFHPDRRPLEIIAEVLGGGRASTLSRELRYKRGLIYGVGAYLDANSDSGAWVINAPTTKGNIQQVMDIICDELGKVVKDGLSDSEIKFAKSKKIKSLRTQMQTSADWVNTSAEWELFSRDKTYTLANYVKELTEVTPEDIKRVAQTYFVPGSWYLAMCGNIQPDQVKVNF